jgi:hypothetical protein
MAEGEELRTDYHPTIRPILTFCLPAAVHAMEDRGVHVLTMLVTTKQE